MRHCLGPFLRLLKWEIVSIADIMEGVARELLKKRPRGNNY